MRYQWKTGCRVSGDAQVIGERLETISIRNGGALTPASVVEDAESDDSPLHECFEWDDTRAAGLYRDEQARHLIRHIVLVPEERTNGKEHSPQIAYIHVQHQDHGSCYMTSAEVMEDGDLRDQALSEALALLRGIQHRFNHLQELADVFAAIDKASESVKPKQKQRRKKETA